MRWLKRVRDWIVIENFNNQWSQPDQWIIVMINIDFGDYGGGREEAL